MNNSEILRPLNDILLDPRTSITITFISIIIAIVSLVALARKKKALFYRVTDSPIWSFSGVTLHVAIWNGGREPIIGQELKSLQIYFPNDFRILSWEKKFTKEQNNVNIHKNRVRTSSLDLNLDYLNPSDGFLVTCLVTHNQKTQLHKVKLNVIGDIIGANTPILMKRSSFGQFLWQLPPMLLIQISTIFLFCDYPQWKYLILFMGISAFPIWTILTNNLINKKKMPRTLFKWFQELPCLDAV